jgi:hypothetical protein
VGFVVDKAELLNPKFENPWLKLSSRVALCVTGDEKKPGASVYNRATLPGDHKRRNLLPQVGGWRMDAKQTMRSIAVIS